jgi:small subunit ribosomal protein S16
LTRLGGWVSIKSMLRMRLQRRGKRNYATYRVVVAEQTAPVKGRFIDDVGSYNPHTNDFLVDKEKVEKWIGNGVKPSDTVHNLLVTHKLIKADKVTSWKVPTKKQAEKAAETKEEEKKEVKTA